MTVLSWILVALLLMATIVNVVMWLKHFNTEKGEAYGFMVKVCAIMTVAMVVVSILMPLIF